MAEDRWAREGQGSSLHLVSALTRRAQPSFKTIPLRPPYLRLCSAGLTPAASRCVPHRCAIGSSFFLADESPTSTVISSNGRLSTQATACSTSLCRPRCACGGSSSRPADSADLEANSQTARAALLSAAATTAEFGGHIYQDSTQYYQGALHPHRLFDPSAKWPLSSIR